MNEPYQSEQHMRAAHPMISNHLVTIASYQDGVYTATTAGKTYQWRAA